MMNWPVGTVDDLVVFKYQLPERPTCTGLQNEIALSFSVGYFL